MNGITFTIQSGGLGRPLAGEDHITGIVTYIPTADLPSGFGATDRIKTIYSVADAETLGIVSTSAIAGIKVLHYNISELFRINRKAVVFVGIYDTTSIDYSAIETVQNYADGKIRQFGVITHSVAYASGTVTSLNTSCVNMMTANKPAICLLGCDTSSIALASLADLTALGKQYVSLVNGQDGAGTGSALATSIGKSVPNVGAFLGLISASKVNECIAWISKFNTVTGTENDIPAFGNSALLKNQTDTLINAINAKGWLFFVKQLGIAGTYANDSHTATATTSDFCKIESNRTIQKAIRGVRAYLLPDVASPLYLNADGTLTETTLSHFKNNASRALEQMERDGEISAFDVTIDPVQDVLSTSTIAVGITVVPVGVARQISVNIGFAVSL